MKKILTLLFISILIFCLSQAIYAQNDSIVSPALHIIAANSDMAKSEVVGNEIYFTESDFCRALNISNFDYITIEKIPSSTDGELLMSSVAVKSGQIISRSNIDKLKYQPSKADIRSSSFVFSVDGSPYSIDCNLYMLSRKNESPTVSFEKKSDMNVSTYCNISAVGRIMAYEPEGDDMKFEVISYAKNGSLKLDSSTGEYIYTPYSDFCGSDSFKYVAVDCYGNYSSPAEMSISVKENTSGVYYDDIVDASVHVAAISMTESGIMSGVKTDNNYYFFPNQNVSKVEFLVMAMKTAGISPYLSVQSSGFADDADIPSEFRGYVLSALAHGYIKGSVAADGSLRFNPSAPLTRAEAAVMMSAILGNATECAYTVFADSADIPEWARDAIYSLKELGIITSSKGYISANAYVTREESAKMLDSFANAIKKV